MIYIKAKLTYHGRATCHCRFGASIKAMWEI